MARKRRQRLRESRLQSRVRYGPELRGLSELAAEARDTLEFDVDASRGAAAGILSSIDDARPRTKQIYARADEQMDAADADLARHGAMTGLFADAAAREEAGAERRVAESRAGALSDLASREVGAEEGRAFAVRNAVSDYRKRQDEIGRQRQGLKGDMAAFQLSTYQQLSQDDRQMRMDERRLRQSARTERRMARQTEADITGIDPATGLPTAGERDRQHDNALGDRTERRQERNQRAQGGHTAGQIKDHRGIVSSIQDARADAARMRRNGAKWSQIRQGLVLKRDEDPDSNTYNPIGGHGPVISRAAVELARYGHLSDSTIRQLRARGYLPDMTPGWRSRRHPGSATPRNPDGTPG